MISSSLTLPLYTLDRPWNSATKQTQDSAVMAGRSSPLAQAGRDGRSASDTSVMRSEQCWRI